MKSTILKYTVVILIYSLNYNLQAQGRMNGVVYEFSDRLSHDYDSTVWIFSKNIKLKHIAPITILCADSQAVSSKSYIFKNDNLEFSKLQYLQYAKNGLVTELSTEPYFSGTLGQFIVKNATQFSDSCLRYSLNYIHPTTFSFSSARSYERCVVDTVVTETSDLIFSDKTVRKDTLTKRIYNRKNQIIQEYFWRFDNQSVQIPVWEVRYVWNGNLLLNKIFKQYLQSGELYYGGDSFEYDPFGAITKRIVWSKPTNEKVKFRQDVYQDKYDNGKLLTHLTSRVTSTDFINYISNWSHKDSFSYDSGRISVKYHFSKTYDNPYTLKERTKYYYTDGHPVLMLTIGEANPLDTSEVVINRYDDCGVIDSIIYDKNNSNNIKQLRRHYEYAYNTSCQMIRKRVYYISGFGEWRYYYEPFQVIIPEADFGYNLTLSPNPAQSNIKFTSDRPLNIVTIQVFDLIGNRIIVRKFNDYLYNYDINIDNIPPGIYIYKFATLLEVKTGKFIKE